MVGTEDDALKTSSYMRKDLEDVQKTSSNVRIHKTCTGFRKRAESVVQLGVAIATSSVQYREGGASTASLSSPPRLQSPEVVHGAMDLIIFPSIFIMLIFLTCGTLYLIA
ncbi:unnamed protein product [Heligmosomoides polygyrus]|uniref:Transmembrane protein n=1 Tax=Heligmosomoides polygyrus TaxID=6339 RepID=A0A183FLW7_HELPZ|nr:unnamed protein product [Heligmosomoides polygyrus]